MEALVLFQLFQLLQMLRLDTNVKDYSTKTAMQNSKEWIIGQMENKYIYIYIYIRFYLDQILCWVFFQPVSDHIFLSRPGKRD